MKKVKIAAIILIIILLASIALNVYLLFFTGNGYSSYLQEPYQIYVMESGVIEANLVFREGEDVEISYDLDNAEYAELLSEYNIVDIAGSGSEFERAKRLMDEYSGRLTHKGDYVIEDGQMNALYLLGYSLDDEKHGINCRAKAQILNEMCLALGIYSRKLWLMPISAYDTDCHVVNEVWDSALQKWIMLDITNNMYWVDENGAPLSALEVRERIARQEFCTPVYPDDKLNDLERSLDDNYGFFLYIAKNMVYLRYMDSYSVGESVAYDLMPITLEKEFDCLISEESVKNRL